MATQPNLLETTAWLAMEALRLLTNPLEVLPTFNTDYQENLEKEFPVGKTFDVPLPDQFLIRNGLAYNPQPLIDRHTTIACDQVFGVDAEWDSIEAALQMPRGEARVKKKVAGAMKKIHQEWDSRAANFAMLNTPNIVGILGTNPTTFDAIYGAADQRLTELAGNYGDKTMFLSPGMARTLRGGAVSYFHPGDEIDQMFKKGYIGEVTGFGKTFQSMSLYQTTADTWAGAVTTNAANQSGSSLVLVCTTGDTFTQGTAFSIAGVNDVNPMTLRATGPKNFVITATTTGSGSAATIQIYPAIVGPGSPYQNVDALPGASAALTMYPGTVAPNGKVGINGIANGRDAFAFVGIKLQNPKASSEEIVAQEQDPDTSVSIAFIRAFDVPSRKWVNRWDTCGGFGVLWGDHCAVRVLGGAN